jgi:hypothetical protein
MVSKTATEQHSANVPVIDPSDDTEQCVLALTRDDFPATAARLDGAARGPDS